MVYRILSCCCLSVILGVAGGAAAHELELRPTTTLYDGDRGDVCFFGETLFVASATGVEFFAAAQPSALQRIDQIIYSAGVRKVARAGDALALATADDSLLIYDLSDLGGPSRAAGYAAVGTIHLLEAHRNYLYFADQAGWQRINLGQPLDPVLDFIQPTPAPVGAFAFVRDSLFLARTDGLTLVYQIQGLPQAVGDFPLRADIASLVVDEPWVYAAAGDSGVFLYDLRNNPGQMEIGRFDTYGNAREVLLIDSWLCVGDSLRGCMVLGLADPARPFLLGSTNQPRGLRSIDERGSLIAAVAENGVFLIDLIQPFMPQVVGHAGDAYHVGDLAAGQNLLAAAVGGAGLSLLDITGSAPPLILSETVFAAEICGLDLAGELVALAGGDEGLFLIDIGQPGLPMEVFREPTSGFALDVAIDDSLAIVADGAEGFRIFEINDPPAAHLIGGKMTPAAVTGVARRDDFVFVFGPDLGWQIYDISFAFKPTRMFSYTPPGLTRDLHLIDHRAFLAVDSVGVLVFDIGVPSSPILIEEINLAQHPRRVVGERGLLFIVDDSLGISMIDYRTPGNPALISTTPLAAPIVSAAYTGERLYLAADPYLHIMDIYPPLQPGDFDQDGIISLIDIVCLVNYFYRGGPAPFRTASADLNGDGRLNPVDLVCLIHLVFPQ